MATDKGYNLPTESVRTRTIPRQKYQYTHCQIGAKVSTRQVVANR